jgi:broad specificity phosphatase PhoE
MSGLILVRHGETAWNREKVFRGRVDIPLSERGLRQAELTARALSISKIEAIYTSPLQRSLRTAEAIAKHTGAPLRTEAALTDIDFGAWAGMPREQVKEQFPDLYRQWKNEPHLCQLPNGESLKDVWKRAGEFARSTAGKHEGAVVIVTHRVVLKALILAALGLGPEHFWSVRMDTCSLSALDCEKAKAVLSLLNDTCHLAGERDSGAADF